MASPHFRVLKQTDHLISSQRPDVLQLYSDVEKIEVWERSGILCVCMSVCSFRPWDLARREGRRATSLEGVSYTWGILL